MERGKELRKAVPRGVHSEWSLLSGDRDPVDIIIKSNEGRVSELVPIRHARMAMNPFTFLRGFAAVMVYDLSNTPTTGLTVQVCGDCHLSNFGMFAFP